MTPQLIGYFPKLTLRRATGWKGAPPGVDELGNVACASDAPENWMDLWLHNAMWVYDTELLAWAVLTDPGNLKRLIAQPRTQFYTDHGGIAKDVHDYVTRHIVLPCHAPGWGPGSDGWDLYAYRAFPVRFVNGLPEPFEFPSLDVQPLPEAYEHLGYDPVSRSLGNVFEHSPLWCNGWWRKVGVNRHCLLDDAQEALRLAQHFSSGHKDKKGSYIGPAEPGPYFVLEVLRRCFA